MMRALLCTTVVLFLLAAASAFAEEQLAYFPADSKEDVVDAGLVELDQKTSHDGKGALRIEAERAVTVRLFEVSGLDVENARLVYQALLKSRRLQGSAYLKMYCEFEGLGTYFSRALHAPIQGDADWVAQETPFFLQAGQNPALVRLNLVLTGPGTVWVDSVRLLRLPLQ